jgi:hypothetical protein
MKLLVVCLSVHPITSLLGPNIVLSILFSNTLLVWRRFDVFQSSVLSKVHVSVPNISICFAVTRRLNCP